MDTTSKPSDESQRSAVGCSELVLRVRDLESRYEQQEMRRKNAARTLCALKALYDDLEFDCVCLSLEIERTKAQNAPGERPADSERGAQKGLRNMSKTLSAERGADSQQRLVRHSCELCNRDGQLVCQTVEPKPGNSNPDKYPQDHRGPWVFRYWLCRWHRAAWNRTRMDSQRKMTVLEYVDDATLLANAALCDPAHGDAGKPKTL